VTQTLSVVAESIVPFAVVFSILKYRLYDIELVINRSIVYGSLTLILVAVFGVILYGLQSAYTAITHQTNPPTLAIVISTIVVSSIFQPTRKSLRRFVKRKIYGMDVDIDEMKRRSHKMDQIAHLPAQDVTSIGGYANLELIARGGMGEIYKGRHPSLNRVVAIKVLSSYLKDDPDLNKRFAREAKTMAQLRHPNIITIHDFGERDGLPYIVMEYLTGETLADVLKTRTRLSLDESLPLLQDLASALDYAHGQGVIHRDIKPSNVIIEPVTTSTSARSQRAILMDFGIARFIAENTMITVTGDMLGTADYISPEQVHNSENVDHRADIYSFGVMTYQVLTGKKPFERNNTWAMIRSHLEEPPPHARDVAPSLPESAAKAIIKAMAKKPEDRFVSAGEFVGELRKL
jgi:serine/threonine protein kinase